MSAPPLPDAIIDRIRESFARTGSKAATAIEVGVSWGTVARYVRETAPLRLMAEPGPMPADAAFPEPIDPAAPGLPDPIDEGGHPLHFDDPGEWLILNDVHIPFHDPRTIHAAVDEARERGVMGVLLNGDIADCYQVSDHSRDPDLGGFEVEVEKVRQFLAWLRSRLPRARIVWREGNHEHRLRRFIASKASELRHLKCLHLPELAGLANVGGEWHQDKRVIWLGKLATLHGHELRGGGGVNVGRWLYLQVGGTALMGHLHRTSEHHEPSISGRLHGCWSVGCACSLTPQYLRLNKWNSGYAFVSVEPGGDFRTTNRRVLPDGQVV